MEKKMYWSINRREVRRYLGYGNKDADEMVNRLIEDSICQLEEVVYPKATYQVYPLKCGNDHWLDLSDFICCHLGNPSGSIDWKDFQKKYESGSSDAGSSSSND